MTEEKLHKSRFNRDLEPVKVMLVNRKYKSTHDEWLKFVESTKTSIVNRPDEYLGGELPPHEITTHLVETIFEDFLRDQIH